MVETVCLISEAPGIFSMASESFGSPLKDAHTKNQEEEETWGDERLSHEYIFI